MPDLSVIIPARNEEFLQITINSVLSAAKADTEIIAILDGYWPKPGIKDNEKVTLIHHVEPIGQRGATNEGVRYSQAKYIMKLDAHCAIDDGFDIKLMADCEHDWTVVPRMHNLHAFDWVCRDCGNRKYQGPTPKSCGECGGTNIEREIIWKPKPHCVDYMWFDTDLRFKYFDNRSLEPYGDKPGELRRKYSHNNRAFAKGDITDQMTALGACWFMERERFWELGGLDDEGHGSWGQMGVEIACKSWLSGGRQVVNKKTWFSHMFRTQGGDFGFPYPLSGKDIQKARNRSNELWKNNKWDKAKHNLSWLIERFSPLPGWDKILPTKPKQKNQSKGLVYYTDNQCEERILLAVRDQIARSINGYPIVSVSQYPIDFGQNICVDLERSILSMFKQILVGLKALDTKFAFLVEHDVLYNSDHFEFVPPKDDVYFYNKNVWMVDAKTGQAAHYDPMKHVSAMCANREFLIEHYEKRIAIVERDGFSRRMGFEPGKPIRHGGVDDFKYEYFESKTPIIDIKHDNTITPGRFKLEQYRCKNKIRDSWVLSDEVPGWGKTKNNMHELLKCYELQTPQAH